jgi:biotin operon repressor
MLHLSIIIDTSVDQLREHGLKIFNEKRKGFDRDERTG